MICRSPAKAGLLALDVDAQPEHFGARIGNPTFPAVSRAANANCCMSGVMPPKAMLRRPFLQLHHHRAALPRACLIVSTSGRNHRRRTSGRARTAGGIFRPAGLHGMDNSVGIEQAPAQAPSGKRYRQVLGGRRLAVPLYRTLWPGCCRCATRAQDPTGRRAVGVWKAWPGSPACCRWRPRQRPAPARSTCHKAGHSNSVTKITQIAHHIDVNCS